MSPTINNGIDKGSNIPPFSEAGEVLTRVSKEK